MNNFKTVLYYDWLQIKRSASFWLITALLFCMGIYALYYGYDQVKEQQHKIAVLKHAIDSTNNNFYTIIKIKDTTALEPFLRTGMLFADYPQPLAALSFGERDIHKFALNLATYSFFYDKYSTGYDNKTLSAEIVNPMKLLAGNLDLSFVLVFLLPLYFILIAYNIFSSEKENGTFSLLSIQGGSIRKIIAARLFLRLLITVLPGFVLIAAGAMIAQADILPFLFFLFVFLSYMACWSGIILLFCRNNSSGRNAIMLITAWLMICFVLPGLYNSVLNAQHPVDSKTALSASIQKAESEFYPMPAAIKLDSFLRVYPQYRAATTDTLGDWKDARLWSCTFGLMDHYTEPYEKRYQQAWSHRIQAADKWNYGSPALLAQYAFNELAASNAEQMQSFDTLAYTGFQQRRDYFNDLFFMHNNRFTKADFNKLPEYRYKPAIDYRQVSEQCIFLIGVSFLLWIIAGIRLKKIN